VHDDWSPFADPRHTAVFYMGLAHLSDIVSRLRAAGAGGAHPAALVAHATLPEQQIVRGTLADIAARVRALGVTPPALLIVGNVAAFAGEAPQGAVEFAPPASRAAEAEGALA